MTNATAQVLASPELRDSSVCYIARIVGHISMDVSTAVRPKSITDTTIAGEGKKENNSFAASSSYP